MGFYGNITNTSNTTFNFDRIYPNRLTMDANVNNDGIFIGRYVLVEYQQDAAYPNGFYKTEHEGKFIFYSSPNGEDSTIIKYLGEAKNEPIHQPSDEDNKKYEYEDGFYKGEILQYQYTDANEKIHIEFYKCESYYEETLADKSTRKVALFSLETKDINSSSQYIQNFGIDEAHYGQNSKGFKGYDSTVWVKTSETSNGKLISKYVNIADLNSVVPTFDIAADAPTMTPITPHFDADSTNVYYKLHTQPQWGFRIAQTSTDKSNETTQWVKDFYDPVTDISSKKYASSIINGIPNWDSENPVDLNAAIYFNKDGFKKQLVGTSERQGDIKKHSNTVTENTIKIEPTGKSGIEYNDHNGKDGPSKSVQVDTQELTINLPSIGNMMSDAWDIIHGSNRDNSTVDSLQGRLDFFKNEIKPNEIPVQSNIAEGYLVGTVINGATSYENSEEYIKDNIIDVELTDTHEHDDAWISTKIDTSQGKEGDFDYHRKAIAIHHTFHPDNTNYDSDINKNIDKADSDNDSDKIKLYTPVVDKAGHVVGKKIDTVTLPFGYKTIKAAEQSKLTTNPDINTTEVVADSTQDTLQFASSNKWIRMSGENKGINTNYDTFSIGHEVHTIPNEDNDNTDLNDSTKYYSKTDGNTINIPDWEYDEAGHIKNKHNRKYTLPYGYKSFTDGNNTSSANSTQDEFKFVGDNWLLPTVSEDTITYKHIGPVSGINLQPTSANPKFKGAFDIITWEFDERGHKNQQNKQTITLPTLTKEDNDINSTGYNLISNIEFIDDDTQGQKLQVTRKLVGEVPITNYALVETSDRLNAQDTINQAFGKLQKQIIIEEETRKALDLEKNSSTTHFISEISQTDGQVAIKRAAAGTLALADKDTDYVSTSSNNPIKGTNSIIEAFKNIEAQIQNEKNTRETLFNTLYDKQDGVDIASTFDSIREIAEFLEQENNDKQSGIETIIDKINTNVENIANEKNRAETAENANTTLINTEVSRAKEEEEKINTRIDNLVDKLGDAAYTDPSDYATAEQGALAENALQPDTEFNYGEGEQLEQKTIQELMDIVFDLQSRIQTLENIINNSQE